LDPLHEVRSLQSLLTTPRFVFAGQLIKTEASEKLSTGWRAHRESAVLATGDSLRSRRWLRLR